MAIFRDSSAIQQARAKKCVFKRTAFWLALEKTAVVCERHPVSVLGHAASPSAPRPSRAQSPAMFKSPSRGEGRGFRVCALRHWPAGCAVSRTPARPRRPRPPAVSARRTARKVVTGRKGLATRHGSAVQGPQAGIGLDTLQGRFLPCCKSPALAETPAAGTINGLLVACMGHCGTRTRAQYGPG